MSGGRRATDRYHVQYHNPARRRLTLLFGVAGTLLLAWGAYALGVHASGYRYEAASRELRDLREYTADLEVKYADLLGRATRLRQSSQIEQTAAAEVQEALVGLQDDMLTLNKELLFYKGLVSPSEREPGLHVQNFELQQIAPDEYRYTLVLTLVRAPQWLTEQHRAEGSVEMYVEGAYYNPQGMDKIGPDTTDKAARLSLPELAGQTDDVAFSFKYFQTFEGQVTLPANFTPAQVVLRVKPTDKRLKAVEKTWSWAVIAKEV